jgi:hypothetical protein
VNNKRANGMPAMNVPRETLELIESTAVSNDNGAEQTMLHHSSLQNPTERPRNSPFFWSVFRAFFVMSLPEGHQVTIRADYGSAPSMDEISLLQFCGQHHKGGQMQAFALNHKWPF